MRLPGLLLLVLAGLVPAGAAHAQSVTSVPALDISRYAGQWYEIARLPMSFQKDCAANVTAAYTLREDELIGVRNACRKADGSELVATGVARPVQGHPGRLQVRFAPDWLSWLPFVWADYWVLDLDPGYTWALVGEPGRDYLWILSRDPAMDQDLFDTLKGRAEGMGYQLDYLLVSGALQ